MAGSSAGLHEPEDRLDPATIDEHRALVSIMEELEAVDWYHQRADATTDGSLAEILRHNRDEEKEHAIMTLEWLRRRDPVLDRLMRTYLFSGGDILEIEEVAEHAEGEGEGERDGEGDGDGDAAGAVTPSDGSLRIGTLQGGAG